MSNGALQVSPETAQVRPYVVCAILRGIEFDQARYQSFIDLQDKLHQNICRRRTLASMGTASVAVSLQEYLHSGTHDLAKIEGPFTYDALRPDSFTFVPLGQTEEMDGNRMMEVRSSAAPPICDELLTGLVPSSTAEGLPSHHKRRPVVSCY